MNHPKFLMLSETDNCLIVKQTIHAEEVTEFEGANIKAAEEIPIGFKIARTNIRNGEKIHKWGMSIGSATEGIPQGAVIHTHNMKSDYIPTLLREKQEAFFKNSKSIH